MTLFNPKKGVLIDIIFLWQTILYLLQLFACFEQFHICVLLL